MVSKKEDCTTEKSFKYFIGYIDNDDIRPLCIKLPQMMGYVKVKDKTLFKMYTKTWGKLAV